MADMQYRLDARSGRKISALGFGCMRFPREKDAEELVVRAVEAGVNYFDTAYAYPGNEETLGRILERTGLREQVLIATKLPHGTVRSLDDVDRLFRTSLSRLRTDYVDYYLIHNVITLDDWKRLVGLGIEQWIADRKAEGSLRQVAFSFHGTLPEFKGLLDAYDWDMVQIQYNYMNENFQAGREGLELAAERGLPVVIMEPLLGGTLAKGLPAKAQAALEKACPERSCASWALRWLWDQPAVTCVLSGMNAVEQLEDNLATAADAEPGCLSPSEREAIAQVKEAFGEKWRVPCTGCNYCMPCPAKINIPAAFSAYNESFAVSWFSGVVRHVTGSGITSGDPHFLAGCTGCGACKRKCPQHIDVPRELSAVQKRLEPAVIRPASKVFMKVMRR
ncbi:MAG: aldo/keto reductase [Coriobacteriia bacterium]|nr:aldo/keto reductase [Coriobacteriia bacterium]